MFDFSTHKTARRANGLLVTVLTGRISDQDLKDAFEAYERLGKPDVWLYDAAKATGYTPAAMALAVKKFTEHMKNLKKVVVIIESPLVRMGANVVAMSSRAPIIVVKTMQAAEEELAKKA